MVNQAKLRKEVYVLYYMTQVTLSERKSREFGWIGILLCAYSSIPGVYDARRVRPSLVCCAIYTTNNVSTYIRMTGWHHHRSLRKINHDTHFLWWRCFLYQEWEG